MGAAQPEYPYEVTDKPRDLTDADLAFLSKYTGERDLQKLREHVYKIWRTSKSSVWTYKCIQEFMFLEPRMLQHPYYSKLVVGAKSGNHPHCMDVGACFCQDTRQLILDGFSHDQITAIDIVPDYWQFGLDLFMDRDKLGVKAHFGSLTDDAFVSSTGLVGKAGCVWAGAVLHVLSKADVDKFVKSAYALLAPGGTFFGTTGGCEVPIEWVPTPDGKAKRYLHSPDSLAALMRDAGFVDVDVHSRENHPEHHCWGSAEDGDTGPRKMHLNFTGRKPE